MQPAKYWTFFGAGIVLTVILSIQSSGSTLSPKPKSDEPPLQTKTAVLPASPVKDANSPIKVHFDVLGGWKYIEGKTSIPKPVQDLDGKQIEVSGFMMPINETQNITSFILIQSLWGCCFGQTPDANHMIVVHLTSGKTTEFSPDPIKVIGRFSVGETREEGYLISIYQLKAHQVSAAK